MSDRNAGTELSLGEALRALPLATPPRDVWQALAAELAPLRVVQARSPARRRYALPAAIAAGLLAIAAALLLTTHERVAPRIATVAPTPASSSANGANAANGTSGKSAVVTDPETQLVALETRSQQLEHWLSQTRAAAAPLPGQDLAAAAEIEDLIGLVDVELAAAARKDALPLWRYRVNLLEDLTALRYASYRLAETGVQTAALTPTHLTN